MGGAPFQKLIRNSELVKKRLAEKEKDPNFKRTPGPFGSFITALGALNEVEKEQGAGQGASPGPVEYGGDETDQTGRRRRRRRIFGQAIPARRKSLLAEQSDSEMKTRLGG